MNFPGARRLQEGFNGAPDLFVQEDNESLKCNGWVRELMPCEDSVCVKWNDIYETSGRSGHLGSRQSKRLSFLSFKHHVSGIVQARLMQVETTTEGACLDLNFEQSPSINNVYVTY